MTSSAAAIPASPPALRVRSITPINPRSPLILARALESPAIDGTSDTFTLQITGWVLGQKPFTAIALYDLQGIELHRSPIDISRPDVPAARGAPVGFSFPVTCIGPTPSTWQLVAFAADGSAMTLFHITLAIEPLPIAPLAIAPLLLTSLGRSGSTWVMGMLARHPDIIAHDPHRFDTRVASYFASLFATLSHPRSYLQSVVPQELGKEQWWVGGPLPAAGGWPDPATLRFLGHDSLLAAADFSLRRIDAFYSHLAAVQNRPQAPRFFIEKCDPNIARITLRNLCPNAREILLLRDPRDTVCSVLAFNKKRGFASFGRETVGSDEEYIRWYAGALALLRYTLDTPARPITRFYYEELIKNPRDTLRALLTALELDAAEATLDLLLAQKDDQILTLHRTTASPEASVHRWKTDLPKSLRPAVRTHLDPLLTVLGYEPTPV